MLVEQRTKHWPLKRPLEQLTRSWAVVMTDMQVCAACSGSAVTAMQSAAAARPAARPATAASTPMAPETVSGTGQLHGRFGMGTATGQATAAST